MHREISINGGTPRKVTLTRGASRSTVWLDDRAMTVSMEAMGREYELRVDGQTAIVHVKTEKDTVLVHAFGRAWRLNVADPGRSARQGGNRDDVTKAPMPGVAISVLVKPGDRVTAGQPMMIIESMKMQTEIVAGRDGEVGEVHARVGETFPLHAPLVALVPLAPADASPGKGA